MKIEWINNVNEIRIQLKWTCQIPPKHTSIWQIVFAVDNKIVTFLLFYFHFQSFECKVYIIRQKQTHAISRRKKKLTNFDDFEATIQNSTLCWEIV